jgi:acetylglutamate kinase
MVRVIKIGGRAQGDPGLASALASVSDTATRLCIVHGGGDEVTALQKQLGGEPTFVNGRRVTTPRELDVVRMVLSGVINKRLVGQLLAENVQAAGISGEDGDLLRCRIFADGALGAVGEPDSVNPLLLQALFAWGFVPVISPLGRLIETGAGCNVNGDDAAAAIAGALGADELLLVADVAGVLHADGSILDRIDLEGIDALIAGGTARGGMIAKLESARRALTGGVARVRIGGLGAIRDLQAGTIVERQHAVADDA